MKSECIKNTLCVMRYALHAHKTKNRIEMITSLNIIIIIIIEQLLQFSIFHACIFRSSNHFIVLMFLFCSLSFSECLNLKNKNNYYNLNILNRRCSARLVSRLQPLVLNCFDSKRNPYLGCNPWPLSMQIRSSPFLV